MSFTSHLLIKDFALVGTAVHTTDDDIIFILETALSPDSLEKYGLKLKDCLYLYDGNAVAILSKLIYDTETNTYTYSRMSTV